MLRFLRNLLLKSTSRATGAKAGFGGEVEVDATGLRYWSRSGEASIVRWDELVAVLLETWGTGSSANSVFVMVVRRSKHKLLRISLFARGVDQLIGAFKRRFGGGDEDRFSDALAAGGWSPTDTLFLCWQVAPGEAQKELRRQGADAEADGLQVP